MANPSWSSDNTTFHTLPGKYIFGGKPRSKRRDTIVNTTQNAAKFAYLISERQAFELHFIVGVSDLDDFEDLDTYAAGDQVPYYLSPSGVGAADSVFVRNLDPHFEPQELADPHKTGARFEVILRCEAEIL